METEINNIDTSEVLCYDIETETAGARPNAYKDRLKIFGFYSYKIDKIGLIPFTDKKAIQKVIDNHKFIVGFNNENYDDPILKREGISLEYKRIIDLRKILKQRAGSMMTKKGMLGNVLMKYSLDYITRFLDLVDDDSAKGEMDYNILKKDTWTKQEIKEIKEYTERDIEITKKLYEWMEKYFEGFKDFLSKHDVEGKYYLTDTMAKFGYKAICHALGWAPVYDIEALRNQDNSKKIATGGFVGYPSGEKFEGNIYCLDFNCLPKGELVYTSKGYKKVEDIKVGDKTISLDGKENTFVDKRKKNAKELIIIELKDGTIIKQTPEHKIPTNNGVKQAKNINMNDKLIANFNTNLSNGRRNELLELLGISICEGSLFRYKRWLVDKQHPTGRYSTASQTHLCIKLHEQDFKKHIEYLFKKYIPYSLNFKITKKYSKKCKCFAEFYNIYDTRKEVYNWFDNFKKKYYNVEYITQNTSNIKSFLAGVFKADACWNIKRHSIELRTTDEYRFNIIKRCLECLGVYSSNYKCKKKYGHCNINYIFEIAIGSEIKKIFEWFNWGSYRDDKITYIKNTIFNEGKKDISIRSIKTIAGNFEVYDLTMSRQESPYFIHNGIFTHNSLYPHIMMQCNLFGRNKEPVGWHGGNMWDVEGFYNDTSLHPVGKLLETFYHLRLKYKLKIVLEDGVIVNMKDVVSNSDKYLNKKYKNIFHLPDGKMGLELKTITKDEIIVFEDLVKLGVDRREYTIKIVINSIYGISLNPYYKLVFDIVAGGDCTRIGRQWTKHARKKFRDNKYDVVATDTDSYFIYDHLDNKEKVLEINREIISDIKNSVPFPMSTFDADIDAEIKYIFFFKGKQQEDKESDKEMDEDDIINKPKGFMKKNYIYVETNGELTIKNLGIRKKNISAISKKIFWEYMVPKIKKGQIKFTKTEIDNIMKKYLQQDLSLAYMRKEVNDLFFYKKSMTGIQAQISKQYGPGIHFLIPNIRNIGIGKGVKYCSVEEFKKYGMGISDIDFKNFWKELNYFIKKQEFKKLFDYGE